MLPLAIHHFKTRQITFPFVPKPFGLLRVALAGGGRNGFVRAEKGGRGDNKCLAGRRRWDLCVRECHGAISVSSIDLRGIQALTANLVSALIVAFIIEDYKFCYQNLDATRL